MTKDLALLVGAEQGWLSTEGFLDKVAENLRRGDGEGLIDYRSRPPPREMVYAQPG